MIIPNTAIIEDSTQPSKDELLALPRIEIRAQTPEEEFVWLEQMLSELPWYKENGYTLGMPDNPTLQQPFSPQERE